MISETFIKYNYEIRGEKDSEIAPGAVHYFTEGVVCPRCSHRLLPDIEHGETRICPTCHLEITCYGNRLQCVAHSAYQPYGSG